MLRNGCRTASFKSTSFIQKQQSARRISCSCTCLSKNAFNANRQGKLMNKLFGERVAGSKKRWFPSVDTTIAQTKNGGNLLLKASHLSKPGGAGKNSSRRSAVLNKLFMEEISSLLATGAIADHFLGRGLQLTRVKIAPDFAYVNVYWLGSGEPLADGKLAEDLQHYSGLLRHELSQLRVMGEVPRIHFVQDKTFANIEHVEALLRSLDLNQENSDSEEGRIDFQQGASAHVKHEFYGNKQELENSIEAGDEKSLPPMRHDVFGLDHRGIMTKILTKMKKSKQAWDIHNERQGVMSSMDKSEEHNSSLLNDVELKLADASKNSESEGFNKFLSQRRDRKNTPERKKSIKFDLMNLNDVHDNADMDFIESKQVRDYLNQEDYIHEDLDSERKL